ncbi:putative transporter (transmembrane protein) [Litorimonas taeanensis]|uniref:Small-conductance mechanosensitive channel n=1 Tax=Litorimonas taeanensis TaxID=568099 RepID=A0A420WEB7_9PROT|nr:mechanosensitive ion channel [Litorimonas taeanensis]RKQ69343.1 putative transporter (transmembrane protein) [Litorimonas taeanensis]
MDQFNAMFENMPLGNYVAAAVILIVGIVVAYVLKGLVAGGINRTSFGKNAQTTGGNIGNSIGKAIFWLAILYTLYLALSRLSMGAYLEPVETLFRNIADIIPKLIGFGFTLFIGYIIAKVAKNATTSTLEAAQVDTLMSKTGVANASGSTGSLAKALGTLVFVLIIVPVIVAALGILDFEEVSIPLSNMLEGFLGYIPQLVAASLVLAASIFIGKFVSNFLASFLPSLGFDNSVNQVMMLDDGEGLKTSPSKTAGYVAFLIILVIGVSAAVNILGNDSLSRAFGAVQEFGGELLQAAILIVIGVFLANFISRFMASIISPKIATLVKYVFMLIFIFLGLSSLDPNGDIIPMAFGALVIGSAVAGAIAFGIGGRDWAGKVLNNAFPPANVKPIGKTTAAKKAPAKRATRK